MFSILDRFLQTFVPSHIFLEKSFAPNFDAVYKCRYLRLYQQVRCTFFLWTIHILCTLSNRTIYKSKQTYNGMHSWCRFIWNRANLLALLRVEAIPTNSLWAVGKTHPTKHLNAFRCTFPVEMFENNLNSTSGRPCQRDVLRRVRHSGCPKENGRRCWRREGCQRGLKSFILERFFTAWFLG